MSRDATQGGKRFSSAEMRTLVGELLPLSPSAPAFDPEAYMVFLDKVKSSDNARTVEGLRAAIKEDADAF